MVDGFYSISTGHFPAMVFSISAEGSLNIVAHQIQMSLFLTLSKLFFIFLASLPLSSAYSGLVRFQLLAQSHHLETTILCHFILVLLSSTLMKRLTCYVGIISLISILVWIFSERDLFQVIGSGASCVVYIIRSSS